MRRIVILGLMTSVIGGWLLFMPTSGRGETPAAPLYDDTFWSHWGDGKAELAGYELTYPRYGEARRGVGVTIFVTEHLSNETRVKAESPQSHDDSFPVMKLNLVQDFATGIYDYNLMTSVFVALEPVNGRTPGSSTKISFSSQEWCGHVFAELLFDENVLRFVSHSYFEGEANENVRLDYPSNGLAEDSLPLWARGFAAPTIAPGESRKVKLFGSLELARLRHVRPEWEPAVISRAADAQTISVPAGTFEVDVFRVTTEPLRTELRYPQARSKISLAERSWTFFVEREAPRRLVRWTRSDGFSAELLGSSRLEYWGMNRDGLRHAVEQLGLRPRPDRTP